MEFSEDFFKNSAVVLRLLKMYIKEDLNSKRLSKILFKLRSLILRYQIMGIKIKIMHFSLLLKNIEKSFIKSSASVLSARISFKIYAL